MFEVLKRHLNPGLLKCIGLLVLLDVSSFSSTAYGYLNLMNLYSLIDDPTAFAKVLAVITPIISVPIIASYQRLFKISPKKLIPAVFSIQAISIFLYGVAINQTWWSALVRLIVSQVVSLPLVWASGFFGGPYVGRHLVIEMSKMHGVKLGILNSSSLIAAAIISAIQILIIGQIYDVYSLEDATFYLCTFGLAISLTMGLASRKIFRDFGACPEPKIPNRLSIFGNVKQQFDIFNRLKIRKVMYAIVVSNAGISGTYITLFMLSTGLTPLTNSYIQAVLKTSSIVSCLLNMVKYRFKISTRFADLFLFGHAHGFISAMILAGGWLGAVYIPYLKGEETPESDGMPSWMVVYYLLQLCTHWLIFTISLIKSEFIQNEIPAVDRGAVIGVEGMLSTVVIVTKTCIMVTLQTNTLYLVAFILDFFEHLTTTSIIISYKLDVVREKRLEEQSEGRDEERVPLKFDTDEKMVHDVDGA